MTDRKVAPNVMEFIGRAADLVGAWERDSFSQEMFCNAHDVGLESPLEDLFWTALHAICRVAHEEVNASPDFDESTNTAKWPPGVYVTPQAKFGDYRVDFLVAYRSYGSSAQPVVVELDGHAFHDKDKKQRAYEKARDRALVKAGCRVVHYTGSEVVADPFRVAWEVLDLLGVLNGFSEYDPADPLQSGE